MGYDLATTSRSKSPNKATSLADVIEQTRHALTANELAHVLAVSRITVFKQAKAGRIPSFRLGTCVRFDPHAVARWLRSGATGAPTKRGFQENS
ncbi:MAG: helix-turn-helix domain-containing protein [Terriglobales bacterium]